MVSNARDGIGDSYGGQARATIESPVSNARDGIGDGYGGQARATIESPASNACDGVSPPFISNIFRHGDAAEIM